MSLLYFLSLYYTEIPETAELIVQNDSYKLGIFILLRSNANPTVAKLKPNTARAISEFWGPKMALTPPIVPAIRLMKHQAFSPAIYSLINVICAYLPGI
jgi:hypothetical protein